MNTLIKKLLQALCERIDLRTTLPNMITSITSIISIRRCFYLSAIVLILSTLMATVIIIKLSPLESIKCQPHVITPILEWSTAPNQQLSDALVLAQKVEDSPKRYSARRHNEFHDRREIAKSSRRMRNKILPSLNSSVDMGPNYNVHIFYYAWYRSQSYDGEWKHWNHKYLPNWKKNDKRVYPEGNHQPPADIGSNFYPVLGCYSSVDPKVLDLHMKQLRDTGVGVVVAYWSPSTSSDDTDSIMPDLLDAAHRYQLKVSPHLSSYEGRNPINLLENIKYIFTQYGSHPALFRLRREDGTVLPVMYIYDSYVFPSNAWWELLSDRGNLTLRGTEMDAIYIGLLVEPKHKNHIKKSHFDGFYTYFAINNFSYGSSWKNWRDLSKFAEQNGLLFIPSVGPGYIDTRVQPWNKENSKHRRHGQYYESAWRNALYSGANMVSITSFNQWHEGTQIEPAKPASNKDFTYLDYEPEGSNFYLNLTKMWIQKFTEKLKENNDQLL